MKHQEIIEQIHTSINFEKPVLFVVQLDESLDNDFDMEMCMRLFSLKDQQGILRKKLRRDQQLKLINKLMLPFVLALYNKTTEISIPEIRRHKLGKPYLDDTGFNISDEDKMVSMVIQFGSRADFGVDLAHLHDVERFNSDGEFLDTFKDIFTLEELEYLQQIETDQDLTLTHYWALKESYSKFLGLGLNESFQKFNFKDSVRQLRYSHIDKTQIVPGLYRYDNVQWNQFPLNETDNFTTMLSPQIVCSIFSSSPVIPQVVEIGLEFLVKFVKSSAAA